MCLNSISLHVNWSTGASQSLIATSIMSRTESRESPTVGSGESIEAHSSVHKVGYCPRTSMGILDLPFQYSDMLCQNNWRTSSLKDKQEIVSVSIRSIDMLFRTFHPRSVLSTRFKEAFINNYSTLWGIYGT